MKKSNINYRELTGEDLFGALKDTFQIVRSVLKNNDRMKMWIKKDNNVVFLKDFEIDRFNDLTFDFDFVENDPDDLISYVKLKRTFLLGKSKRIKFNGFELEKRTKIESWKRYSFNHIEKNYKLHISSHNSYIKGFFNPIFIDYFDSLPLSSKKKLHKFMNRVLRKKDLRSVVSFWKYMNNSFNLKFRILVDGGKKYGFIRFESPIYIELKDKIKSRISDDVYLEYLKLSKTERRDKTEDVGRLI